MTSGGVSCIASYVLNSPKVLMAEETKNKCTHEGTTFTDPKFPAAIQSLIGVVKPPEYKNEWDVFQWKRPEQIWGPTGFELIRGIAPSQLQQGFLNDGHLLSAVAILSQHPQLIMRLFSSPIANKAGVYGVWLHINGQWTEYVVDDLFPVYLDDKGVNQFAFSHTKDHDFWMQLIEKAYAKAYGSYYTISGGRLSLALNDLTGAPCESIRLDHMHTADDKLWEKLLQYERVGSLMAFGIKQAQVMNPSSNGLMPGMACIILGVREIELQGRYGKYVRIKSPWGPLNLDKLWPEHRTKWDEKAKKTFGEASSPDWSCWLPFEKSLNFFDEIVSCKVTPTSFFNGVSLPCQKFGISMIHLLEPANTSLSISQVDLRTKKKLGSNNLKYNYVRASLIQIEKNGLKLVDCVFGNGRNLIVDHMLPAGDFALLVEMYVPVNASQSNYMVETYSPNKTIGLTHYEGEDIQDRFLELELEGWKSFCTEEHVLWKAEVEELDYKLYLHKNDRAYIQLEAIYNRNSAASPKSIIFERKYEGPSIEVNGLRIGDKIALQPEPLQCDVAIIKHDPLNKDCTFNMSGFMPTVCDASQRTTRRTIEVLQIWHPMCEESKKKAKELADQQNGAACGSKCTLI